MSSQPDRRDVQMEKPMTTIPTAAFSASPAPTTFVVNVIHAHPGKQEEAFTIIQDVVHYVFLPNRRLSDRL